MMCGKHITLVSDLNKNITTHPVIYVGLGNKERSVRVAYRVIIVGYLNLYLRKWYLK
jgi:hypothetical protein